MSPKTPRRRRSSASPGRGATSDPSAFTRRVLQVVSRIPAGRVSTYGDIARLAGRPRAARAVGRLMATGTRRDLPYHRVVAAGGAVGGYGSSVEMKVALLRAEGLILRGRRIVDFNARRWPDGAGPGRARPRRGHVISGRATPR